MFDSDMSLHIKKRAVEGMVSNCRCYYICYYIC